MSETTFIVAFEGQDWDRVIEQIPPEAIPAKFVTGSAKWTKRAVAWYRETQPTKGVVYVGVLKAPTS